MNKALNYFEIHFRNVVTIIEEVWLFRTCFKKLYWKIFFDFLSIVYVVSKISKTLLKKKLGI